MEPIILEQFMNMFFWCLQARAESVQAAEKAHDAAVAPLRLEVQCLQVGVAEPAQECISCVTLHFFCVGALGIEDLFGFLDCMPCPWAGPCLVMRNVLCHSSAALCRTV